ncbi:ribosome biogenesis protein TSR1, putative, partial [Plasmodium malariae]
SDYIYLCTNISARERFKRYRSLQSFRTSYVDVYEDLPLEYSRIYDYESSENLGKYSKRKYIENCKIINGEYTLTDAYCLFIIKNDGKLYNLIQYLQKKKLPFILSSLLPFERKVTVVNMEIERTFSYLGNVESKEVFEIVCGFRHFVSCPIFSEQIVKSTQAKGKYEKNLKYGKKDVASVYAFTTVTNAPVFIIKKKRIHQEEGRCNEDRLHIQTPENVCDTKNCNNSLEGGEGGINSSNNYISNNVISNNFVSNNDNNNDISNYNIRNYNIRNYNITKYDRGSSNNNGNSSCTNKLRSENINVELFDPFTTNDTNNIMSVLVAHGKVINCDCKRIIMKRISICGKIFKINKKGAVIRNMFYNPKDINYFKPVELHTKFGLTGKILESLGTHGKMKCMFNDVLKQ